MKSIRVSRPYRLFLFLFSLCLSAILLFQGTLNSFEPPTTATSLPLTETVRQTVLENGLTVLTKEVHTTPVVTVQVWYNFGSADETPEVQGVAHLIEHMLFQGTKERPLQFGRLFAALGSNAIAHTSHDTICPGRLSARRALCSSRLEPNSQWWLALRSLGYRHSRSPGLSL